MVSHCKSVKSSQFIFHIFIEQQQLAEIESKYFKCVTKTEIKLKSISRFVNELHTVSFLSYCYYELLTLRLNKLESFGRSKVQKHFHESYSCESDCSGSLVAKESFSSMDKNSADEAASIIDIF